VLSGGAQKEVPIAAGIGPYLPLDSPANQQYTPREPGNPTMESRMPDEPMYPPKQARPTSASATRRSTIRPAKSSA
jgi:hypothetical protein